MELQCTFYKINEGSFSWYTCLVTEASITEPSTIKSFKGQHLQGYDNNSFSTVCFENTVVDYIPKGLKLIFPNLMQLKITNCTLEAIKRHELKGLESLCRLTITRCQLASLPDDLFIGMELLHRVDLSLNQIEFDTSKVFEPLVENKHMIQLDLRGNKNFNERINDSERFSSLLQELMAKIDANCKKPINNGTKEIEKFCGKFGKLWQSGRYSDFTIVVGTKKFLVHKNVLAIENTVFEKIIDEEIEANELKIQDFSESSVEQLLSFLYTGALPSCNEDKDSLVEVLKIAVKFEAAELQTFCEEKLLKLLNDENSLEFFKLGNKISSENLKLEAFRKIDEMFPKKLKIEMLGEPDALEELINVKRSYDLLLEKMFEK